MRVVRLYTNQNLALEMELELDENTRHYAFTVLRLNKNASLTLFNGDGFDYICKILICSKSNVIVNIVKKIHLQTESKLNTHLCLGISKSSHMDYAIQKSVEAGVSMIQPILMERSVTKATDKSLKNKYQHWQRIIQSACEQSGRAVLPVLLHASRIENLENISTGESGLLFDVNAQQSFNSLKTDDIESCKLVIGPEGGITENEINQLIDKGFQKVRCGPRILRTETAAVTAIVAMQLLAGDLCD